VNAIDVTVTARVAEKDFAKIAEDHPRLWRRSLWKLASRLRERGGQVRASNVRPVVSSALRSKVENRASHQAACAHDPVIVRIWTDRRVRCEQDSIEALTAALDSLTSGFWS